MIMISVPCDHRECENSPHWPYSLAALLWSRESTFLKTDKQIINLTYQKSQQKKNHELILDHNQRWALKNANLLTCYCVWPFLKINYTYTIYIIRVSSNFQLGYIIYILYFNIFPIRGDFFLVQQNVTLHRAKVSTFRIIKPVSLQALIHQKSRLRSLAASCQH